MVVVGPVWSRQPSHLAARSLQIVPVLFRFTAAVTPVPTRRDSITNAGTNSSLYIMPCVRLYRFIEDAKQPFLVVIIAGFIAHFSLLAAPN